MKNTTSKITADVIEAALALAQRDVDLGLITIEQIESIPRTRFAPVERQKIAEALKAQGKSNRQIAKAIGTSHQTIGRDLSGPNEPFIGPSGPEASILDNIIDDQEMQKRRAQFLKNASAALAYAQAYDGPIDKHVIQVARAVAATWREFVGKLKEQRHHGHAQI